VKELNHQGIQSLKRIKLHSGSLRGLIRGKKLLTAEVAEKRRGGRMEIPVFNNSIRDDSITQSRIISCFV
jgi:hypothetical protein